MFKEHAFQQSNIMQKQGTVQIWKKKLGKVNIPKAPVSVLQMTTMTEHWDKKKLCQVHRVRDQLPLVCDWETERDKLRNKMNFMLWINYTKLRAEDE